MYVCYGYFDDVMVKQVAGRCHYIIYNLSFSSVHMVSVEIQKIYFQLLTTKYHNFFVSEILPLLFSVIKRYMPYALTACG